MTARKERPSLLEKESTGGDFAEGGFSFQEAVMLASIPSWLAQEGFTMTIREGLTDIEAAYFVPAHGVVRDAIEAKNYSLAPAEFWAEIERFRTLDRSSPGTFQWFTLASVGLSASLTPLANSLRRVRDPYAFYGPGSGIVTASFDQYAEQVVALGRSRDDAQFLFDRLLIVHDWTPGGANAEAIFRKSLEDHFPEFAGYPASSSKAAFQNLLTLVKSRKAKPILRAEIEAAIDAARPAGQSGPVRKLNVHTAKDNTASFPGVLRFEWADFFGGDARTYPPVETWKRISNELAATVAWTKNTGRPRTIQLTGERRLSVAFALGVHFSAVAGFAVEMNHRGEIWATTRHPLPTTKRQNIVQASAAGAGNSLVVSIGVIRPVQNDVLAYIQTTALSGAPTLHLHAPEAVSSAEEANALAAQLKELVTQKVAELGATSVHLFYGGPSHLALFLGHRWNTLARTQLYEWLRAGQYCATAAV